LEAFGVKVAAEEKPRAERIFEKVKKQIEGQYLSVGIFTKARTSRTTEGLIRKPPGMVALRRCPRTGGQNV